jgi:hypothetical protein
MLFLICLLENQVSQPSDDFALIELMMQDSKKAPQLYQPLIGGQSSRRIWKLS